MTSIIIIEPVPVKSPVSALVELQSLVNIISQRVVFILMGASIKSLNCHTTRKVFCAPHDVDDETSAFADTDICVSYFLHVASNEHLLAELFEDEQTMILDYNVLVGIEFDYHIGLGFKNGSLSITRIPRLNPEELSNYRYLKVSLIG